MDIISARSRTFGRVLLLTLLAAIGLAYTFVPQALAAEYGGTASLGLRETYDDNVYFLDKSDFVHRASPSLALAAVTELTEFQVAASFDFTKYQDNSDLDTVAQYYQCLAKWEVTPRLSLNFTGTYVIDYTTEFALREQGVISDRNKRNALAGRPALTYGVGLRDTIEIAYEPYSGNYDHPTERDYKGQEVNLGWIHALQNERTSLKLLFGASQTDYDESDDFPDEKTRDRTVYASAGFLHKFTPTLTLDCNAGARYSHDESDIDGAHSTDQSVGFLGSFRLTQKWERSSLGGRWTRDYSPSTLGENATTDTASLDFWYGLTERLGFGVSSWYSRSEAQYTDREDDKSWAAGVGSGLSYGLTPKLSLRVGYSFTRAESQFGNDQTSRNQVSLGLNWNIFEPEWKVRSPETLVEWPYR